MEHSAVIHDETFAVIGAGRAGGSLAAALAAAGLNLSVIIDRDLTRARALAEELHCTAGADCGSVPPDTAIVFLAVPDGNISRAAKELSEARVLGKNSVTAHLSGLHPAGIMQDLPGYKASFHPCISLAGIRAGQFSGAVITLEGDAAAVRVLGAVALRLGADFWVLSQEKKPAYHAACSVVSNYLVTLMHMADSILEASACRPHPGMLLRLVESTLENLRTSSPSDALTGPIVRGDVETVRTHLQVIARTAPVWLPLYRAAGLAAVELARQAGTDPGALLQIEDILR